MKLSVLSTLATAAVVALTLNAPQADAHGWLKTPVSRETSSRTDIDASMGCPSNAPGQSTTFAPGATIDVRYPRNNHLGGFIRWAIVPRGKESKAAFDANVFHYTCRESGATCLPAGTNAVYAGDNGAPENSILCGDKITLPNWLPAGDYVLQWTWMSAGSSYGKLAWANEIYRSCADIKFTAAGTGKKPVCPSFVGGDRVTKLQGKGSNQCFYFYTNDIASTIFKGDESNYQQYYKFGVPAQVQKCSGGTASDATTAPSFDFNNLTTPTPGAGTVTTGKKQAWEFCTADAQCANGCCSKKLSDDGQLKCTPGGCSNLGDWEFCSKNAQCANKCCSKKLSDDGKLKCTPGGC